MEQRNVRIVGCKEGRVVGDRSEVLLFETQHINGVEFEGPDGVAQCNTQSVSSFVCVGANTFCRTQSI